MCQTGKAVTNMIQSDMTPASWLHDSMRDTTLSLQALQKEQIRFNSNWRPWFSSKKNVTTFMMSLSILASCWGYTKFAWNKWQNHSPPLWTDVAKIPREMSRLVNINFKWFMDFGKMEKYLMKYVIWNDLCDGCHFLSIIEPQHYDMAPSIPSRCSCLMWVIDFCVCGRVLMDQRKMCKFTTQLGRNNMRTFGLDRLDLPAIAFKWKACKATVMSRWEGYHWTNGIGSFAGECR